MTRAPVHVLAYFAIGSLALGCGDAPAGQVEPDARAADAAGDPDAPVAASCADIPLETNDLESWRADTVDWLRDGGNAAVTSEHQSTDTIHISGIDAPLPTGTAPEDSALAWLASLPDAPIAADELAVIETKDQFDSRVVVVGRARVGAVEARFGRPLASILLQGDGSSWSVRSFTLWASVALATDDVAAALAACSPANPPDPGAARAFEYSGLTFVGCALTGEYTYRPGADDVVAFGDAIDWVAVSEDDTERGPLVRWRARRQATLTIAPDNYWDDIGEADCYCGFDHPAGFELTVDASSGEVLEFRPGINCVVC